LEPAEFIDVNLDRDSVHPGDDIFPHAETLRISSSATLIEFLHLVRQTSYLAGMPPGITEGKSTWLIDGVGARTECLGVIARQWSEPALILPPETPLRDLLQIYPSGFYFRDWCQADPQIVFECILTGKDLPDKFQ
jgi:hypothetical protein